MENYYIIAVAVAVLDLGAGTIYVESLNRRNKDEVIRRSRSFLSGKERAAFEIKVENMLPREVRRWNAMSNAEFRQKAELLVK